MCDVLGADVELACLQVVLLKGKLLSPPLGTPCFVERSRPRKIKFCLIFIQLGFCFFLQQLENEVIVLFSGIFFKNIKFMFSEVVFLELRLLLLLLFGFSLDFFC